MTIGKVLMAAVLAASVSAWTSCSGGEKSSLMANGRDVEKMGCCTERKDVAVASAKGCCAASKVVGAPKSADECCGFCGTGKAGAGLAPKGEGPCPCGDKKKQAAPDAPSNR